MSNQINNQKHIIFISPAGFGGIQSWCISLGEKLLNENFNVTIIWEQNRSNQVQNPEVPQKIKEINYLGGRFVNQSWALRKMTNLLKTADIVYPNTSSLGYRALAHLREKTPVVIAGCHSITEHDINTIAQFEPICNAIFTLSERMTEILKKHIPKKSHSKLKVIRHGVNIIKETKQSLSSDIVRLLVVGRLDENKQPQLAIEILNKLIKNGIKAKLTIIGDGALKLSIQEMINKFRLKNFTEIVGNIEKKLVSKHYEKSHFTLLLSKTEGFGLVALEAMSFGSIPIVTNTTGVSEIIVNGENGFVVETSNIVDEVSAIILKTSQSTATLKKISDNSKNTISESLNSYHSFKSHLDLIDFTRMNTTKRSQINAKFKKGFLDCVLIPNILTYHFRKILK